MNSAKLIACLPNLTDPFILIFCEVLRAMIDVELGVSILTVNAQNMFVVIVISGTLRRTEVYTPGPVSSGNATTRESSISRYIHNVRR